MVRQTPEVLKCNMAGSGCTSLSNINPQQVMLGISMGAEFYPSEEILVTERLVRVSDDRIHYEFTIEDPVMFTAPIRGQVPFHRLDGLLYEYACHEGNYALENVLRGARAQERNENEREPR